MLHICSFTFINVDQFKKPETQILLTLQFFKYFCRFTNQNLQWYLKLHVFQFNRVTTYTHNINLTVSSIPNTFARFGFGEVMNMWTWNRRCCGTTSAKFSARVETIKTTNISTKMIQQQHSIAESGSWTCTQTTHFFQLLTSLATVSLWASFESEFHKCGWIGNRSLQINIWI